MWSIAVVSLLISSFKLLAHASSLVSWGFWLYVPYSNVIPSLFTDVCVLRKQSVTVFLSPSLNLTLNLSLFLSLSHLCMCVCVLCLCECEWVWRESRQSMDGETGRSGNASTSSPNTSQIGVSVCQENTF